MNNFLERDDLLIKNVQNDLHSNQRTADLVQKFIDPARNKYTEDEYRKYFAILAEELAYKMQQCRKGIEVLI